MKRFALPTLLALTLVCIRTICFAEQKLDTVYSFQNTVRGTPLPTGLLAADRNGNLYGVELAGGTYTYGSVYELTKDKFGNWQETVLYSFTGGEDGRWPQAGVILDDEGNVYGTTANGGQIDPTTYCGNQFVQGCGVAFELRKRSNGWYETILHTFQGQQDGAFPFANLTLQRGSIYGTTEEGGGTGGEWGYGCGSVFKLRPTDLDSGSWQESVLYRFNCLSSTGALATGNIVFDSKQNLFSFTRFGGTGGDDGGCGVVFELSPQDQADDPEWDYHDLHDFNCDSQDGEFPQGNLVIDRSGNIYGSTEAGGTGTSCAQSWWGFTCGTIFEVSPTSDGWQESIVYNFQGGSDGSAPMTGVTISGNGQLFGTTEFGPSYGTGCGSVFSLSQVVQDQWFINVLYHFSVHGSSSCLIPASAVLLDDNNLFGVIDSGGAFGAGMVYSVPSGEN